MSSCMRIVLPLLTIFLLQISCHAQICLPKVFGDSMVLQRGIKIPVWGNATPRALVTAKLGDEQAIIRADKEGRWKLTFPVFTAGGPYVLEISESGKPN